MIKLKPIGRKKQISYRIVVGEKHSKLKGKFVEDLGWYNPHTDKFSINSEKAKSWISSGAQPTDTVHNILITAKVIEGNKIPLQKKSKQPEKPAAVPAPDPVLSEQISTEPEQQEQVVPLAPTEEKNQPEEQV